MHVLIAGGGVGGLCLAQGLSGAGVEITVFERDPAIAVREQGYRIHIDADGDAALRRCLPSDLVDLHLAASTETGAVNRLTLREILAHGLDNALRFDAKVTEFVEYDDQVEVRCADGSTATGDVLIAADGINSLLRKRLLPGTELIDTGLRCIYGRTPVIPDERRGPFTALSDEHGHTLALAAFDPRQPISAPFLTPVAPYLMWAVLTPAHRFSATEKAWWDSGEPEALHRLALQVIADWKPDLREIVKQAAISACIPITIRSSVPVPPWPTRRITLLGDAIHAMTPAGGIGANTALRDAALLTDQLAAVDRGEAELRPALAEYEARMREYGFAAVASSLRAMETIR
ncbi:MAG TPA: NAD(P)/FAD-dependent oxidoreductase [Pseudonocardiaceae bacterium]|nr:NAD(P)/FAD-dependent oxidoreductase [Pseudonocardiaceae bacterium]